MAIKANPSLGVDTLMKFYTNMAVTACYGWPNSETALPTLDKAEVYSTAVVADKYPEEAVVEKHLVGTQTNVEPGSTISFLLAGPDKFAPIEQKFSGRD